MIELTEDEDLAGYWEMIDWMVEAIGPEKVRELALEWIAEGRKHQSSDSNPKTNGNHQERH